MFLSVLFPAQSSLPELTGPTLYDDNGDTFYFRCEIGYPVCDPDNTARFKVSFWADDETTEATVKVFLRVNCTHPYAELDYLSLKGHLGKEVTHLHCNKLLII